MAYRIHRILGMIISVLFLQHDFSASAADIVYPGRAVPVIVKTGETFDILFRNVCGKRIDSVDISAPYSRTRLVIDTVVDGKILFDSYTQQSVNNKITVRVPLSVPEDLYNLNIFSCGHTHVSPVSVKVIREYHLRHRFIHISDPHISRQWEGTADEGYAKELELFDRFVEVANIISPDFIIVTGDLIHHYTLFDADSTGWGENKKYNPEDKPGVEEKYRNYFDGAQGFSGIGGLNSPVFSLPGNHDFYGIKGTDYMAKALQWNQFCGLRVYGFSYGGTRVLVADDSLGDPVKDIPDNRPMSGLQGKVLENFLAEKGTGDLRIMAQHRPDRIDTAFLNRNKISLLLNGHRHNPSQEYVGSNPTLSSRPGAVCRSGEIKNWKETLGFFRIFTVNRDSLTYTPPLRICENPTLTYNQLKMNLTLSFLKPNNGKASANEAVITNLFDSGLPECKIRFVMKKGDYLVTGGRVLQTITNDSVTVMDVLTDVGSKSARKVEINPNN